MELQPSETLIPSAKAYLPNQVLANTIEEVETRLDDLRSAQCLVKKYQESDVEFDEDIQRFSRKLEKVWKIFVDAVSTLNVSAEENQFDDCLTAYENALDGYDEEGKFDLFWKKLLSKKKVSFSITFYIYSGELSFDLKMKNKITELKFVLNFENLLPCQSYNRLHFNIFTKCSPFSPSFIL